MQMAETAAGSKYTVAVVGRTSVETSAQTRWVDSGMNKLLLLDQLLTTLLPAIHMVIDANLLMQLSERVCCGLLTSFSNVLAREHLSDTCH